MTAADDPIATNPSHNAASSREYIPSKVEGAQPGQARQSPAIQATFHIIGINGQVLLSAEMELKGKGAIKQVYKFNAKPVFINNNRLGSPFIPVDNNEKVFITGEKAGIEAELQKKEEIKSRTTNDSEYSHLDVEFTKLKISTERTLDKLLLVVYRIYRAAIQLFFPLARLGLAPDFLLSTAYTTKAANADLENTIKNKALGLKDRIDLVAQSFKAVGQLNALGFTHGDLKPDNFLIYGEGEKRVVKLSDFDKTQTAAEAKSAIFYQGNLRTRPPEGHKGPPHAADAWGATINAIRILEELILQDGGPLLIPPEDKKAEILTGEQSKAKLESLRGFEKAVALHKDFKAQPTKGMDEISLINLDARTDRSPEEQKAILEFTANYIDALTNKLAEENVLSQENAKELSKILKSGTAPADLRPNAETLAKQMSAFLETLKINRPLA